MSVVTEFYAKVAPADSREVFISGSNCGQSGIFSFDIHCKFEITRAHHEHDLFFSIKRKQVLVTENLSYPTNSRSRCYILPFYVMDDLPFLSSAVVPTWVLNKIADDFKNQLAAYLIDTAINS